MLNKIWRPGTFLMLVALKFAVYFLISVRWWRILRELSVPARLNDSLWFSFLATFFAYFLPGNMSSDVAKSAFAARTFGSTGRVIFAIAIDRIMGLLSLLAIMVLGFVAFALTENEKWDRVVGAFAQVPWFYVVLVGLSMMIAGFALLYFILKHPKFLELKKVLFELRSIRFWLETFGLSLLSHLVFTLFLAFTARALELPGVDFLSCLIIFPVSTFAMIIPITPGSLGVGQVLYQYLFDLYAGHSTQASMIFTALQVIELIFVVLGAWYFTRALKPKK